MHLQNSRERPLSSSKQTKKQVVPFSFPVQPFMSRKPVPLRLGMPPGDGLHQDRTAKEPLQCFQYSPPGMGPSPFTGPQTPRPQVAGESPEASLSSHTTLCWV